MNKQKNKTISFVAIMIAAATITGLVASSLAMEVQAEKDQGKYESNYNDNKQESNYNDNKYKQESNYNDNYASDEYAKYYDPKDKNVKVEVIKCDNSITNINPAESSNSQEPVNVGVDVFGVQGAEEEPAGASGMNGMDENKLAQLSIDKNTVVVCWSHNDNHQNNNLPNNQQNQQAANSDFENRDQSNDQSD